MKTKVISAKNFPARVPTSGTLLWYLFLDHVNAPGWVWGVVGVLLSFGWIVWIASFWMEESVELRELKETPIERETNDYLPRQRRQA